MPPLLCSRIFPTFPKPSLKLKSQTAPVFWTRTLLGGDEQEAEYLRKRGLLTATAASKSMMKSVHELSAVIYDLRI
jgi:hypothetical protein